MPRNVRVRLAITLMLTVQPMPENLTLTFPEGASQHVHIPASSYGGCSLGRRFARQLELLERGIQLRFVIEVKARVKIQQIFPEGRA